MSIDPFRRLVPILVYLAVASFGGWMTFRPTWESDFAQMQADPGDTVLNHYVLEHSLQWLIDSDYPGTLWTAPIFHPAPRTLAYSENLLGTAPLYWLLRAGFTSETAYQLWMIVLTVLAFATMALVLRWFGLPHLLCALGGFLFAFAMPFTIQIAHQQLIPRLFMPLAVYTAWAFLQTPSSRGLIAYGVWWVLQLWSGIYLSWLLTLGIGFLVLATLCIQPGTFQRIRTYWSGNRRTILLIFAGTALAAAPVLVPYVLGNLGFGRSYDIVEKFLPRPWSWLYGPQGSRWSETLHPLADATNPFLQEHSLFAGFGLLAIAALGIIAACRHRVVACFVAAGIGLVLISMQWSGEWSAWRLIHGIVPGGRGIRAVGRIFIIVYLFVLIGGLLGLHLLAQRWIRSAAVRGLLYAGLASLCIYEQTGWEPSSFPHAVFYSRIDPLAEQLREADVDAAYVEGDPSQWWLGNELVAMWAGLRANVPVINGYSGRIPKRYPFETALSEEQLREWLVRNNWRGRLLILRHGQKPTILEL